jgi:Helix-turn-helix
MTARTTWTEVKTRRFDSPERRRGYDRAGRAIRLAFEIRALREKKGLSQRQLAELVGTTQSRYRPTRGRTDFAQPANARPHRCRPRRRSHRHLHRHQRASEGHVGGGVNQTTRNLCSACAPAANT